MVYFLRNSEQSNSFARSNFIIKNFSVVLQTVDSAVDYLYFRHVYYFCSPSDRNLLNCAQTCRPRCSATSLKGPLDKSNVILLTGYRFSFLIVKIFFIFRECWCVDVLTGIELLGTRTSSNGPLPDCTSITQNYVFYKTKMYRLSSVSFALRSVLMC